MADTYGDMKLITMEERDNLISEAGHLMSDETDDTSTKFIICFPQMSIELWKEVENMKQDGGPLKRVDWSTRCFSHDIAAARCPKGMTENYAIVETKESCEDSILRKQLAKIIEQFVPVDYQSGYLCFPVDDEKVAELAHFRVNVFCQMSKSSVSKHMKSLVSSSSFHDVKSKSNVEMTLSDLMPTSQMIPFFTKILHTACNPVVDPHQIAKLMGPYIARFVHYIDAGTIYIVNITEYIWKRFNSFKKATPLLIQFIDMFKDCYPMMTEHLNKDPRKCGSPADMTAFMDEMHTWTTLQRKSVTTAYINALIRGLETYFASSAESLSPAEKESRFNTISHILPCAGKTNIDMRTGKITKRKLDDYMVGHIDVKPDFSSHDPSKPDHENFKKIHDIMIKIAHHDQVTYLKLAKLSAVLLLGNNTEQCFFIVGSSRNGKSVYLKLLERLMTSYFFTPINYKVVQGKEASSSATDHSGFLSAIENKYIFFLNEPNKHLDFRSDFIKNVSTPGQSIQIRPPGAENRNIINKGHLIVCCNPEDIRNKLTFEDAIARRVKILEFKSKFVTQAEYDENEKLGANKEPHWYVTDPKLMEDIMSSPTIMNEFLMWIVKVGIPQCQESTQFERDQEMQDHQAEYGTGGAEKEWLESICREKPGESVSQEVLGEHFARTNSGITTKGVMLTKRVKKFLEPIPGLKFGIVRKKTSLLGWELLPTAVTEHAEYLERKEAAKSRRPGSPKATDSALTSHNRY